MLSRTANTIHVRPLTHLKDTLQYTDILEIGRGIDGQVRMVVADQQQNAVHSKHVGNSVPC